jgi:hypothetical protein
MKSSALVVLLPMVKREAWVYRGRGLVRNGGADWERWRDDSSESKGGYCISALRDGMGEGRI